MKIARKIIRILAMVTPLLLLSLLIFLLVIGLIAFPAQDMPPHPLETFLTNHILLFCGAFLGGIALELCLIVTLIIQPRKAKRRKLHAR